MSKAFSERELLAPSRSCSSQNYVGELTVSCLETDFKKICIKNLLLIDSQSKVTEHRIYSEQYIELAWRSICKTLLSVASGTTVCMKAPCLKKTSPSLLTAIFRLLLG